MKLGAYHYSHPLNAMVEGLTLLLHIQDVLGSNLSPETGCSFFMVFLCPSRQMLG
jgi:hypothetical protein